VVKKDVAHPPAGRHHAIVKLAAALKSSHGRNKHGLVLLEGLRVIETAIASHFSARAALLTPSALREPSAKPIVRLLSSRGIPIHSVPEVVYRKITAVESPQGAVLICSVPRLELSECLRGDWILVVDRVQDPGNLGTILRSARAFGVDGIITTAGTCDVANPKTLRAAAGAWPGIGVAEGVAAERLFEELLRDGRRIFSGASRGGRDFRSVDWRGRIALILGNEGQGVDDVFLRAPANAVGINHLPCVESLNVSQAAAILLAEGFRARGASHDNLRNAGGG
jgi:TrmH family RNA methyltransferase